MWARQQIIEKKIRVFTLPGFEIARKATDRADLQLRMQGNAFLGAFFSVSPLLQEFRITQEQFHEVVHKQYVKKFGRLGDAVVKSNMEVMTQGFERVQEIPIGELAAADRSSMRGKALLPVLPPENGTATATAAAAARIAIPEGQEERTPLTRIASFDAEFRSNYGYNQPATPYASLGIMAAGSGDTASKYVARRETPLYIAENCTQCMECIAVCPDTALPNCSQDLGTMLQTAVTNYVTDRGRAPEDVPIAAGDREAHARADARHGGEEREDAVPGISIREVTNVVDGFSPEAKSQFFAVIDKVPMAYQKTNAIFATPEKKTPGAGGVFSIFVSDLCKGCAACVTACGEHQALRMVQETEEVNAEHETGTAFLDLLPDTSQKYLGLYNDTRPQDSKTATLRNMLMVRRNYDALVSGDGACAGCGEKSILKAITSVTEAYMRPLFHAKADRFRAKADQLERDGVAEAGGAEGAEPGGVRPVPAGRRAPADGTRRRGREGHEGAHRRARPDFRQGHRRRDHGGDAPGSVQSQEPPGHRRPPRQRHVGDGDGGAHGLQHGVRLDAVEQPASVPLDEFAVPGRRHGRLAARRELHRRSRPPVGDSRAARRRAAAPRHGRHQSARVLRVPRTSATPS